MNSKTPGAILFAQKKIEILQGCVLCIYPFNMFIHYIHSIRINDLVSHTTYVVCINFIHKWRDLQFKIDSKRQIFCETFHGKFIYSPSFCQKSAERKSPKKYFSYFVLMSGLGLNPRFSSNKPTHYLLEHGDFMYIPTYLFSRLMTPMCIILTA